MSAGNPELVIEDGWLIRKFIDSFLAGGNIDVRTETGYYRFADVHCSTEIESDGMPWLVGIVLDENYDYVPSATTPTQTLAVPWESIVRIVL